VEEYLPVLQRYLTAGAFFNTFRTKRNSLRPKTITSYISFVHKYLEVLVGGINKRSAGNSNPIWCDSFSDFDITRW
jgi:hypothetical protein